MTASRVDSLVDSLVDFMVASAVGVAERGAPDAVVRAGMRTAMARRLATEADRERAEREAWLVQWSSGPVALVPDEANRQHYEVPAAFFRLILGPRLKYSSGLWVDGDDLASSEERMLDLTIDQAGVSDGMRVLDLGCGWGSISLRVAERFPSATVVAVSNSASQGEFIARRAADRGLTNVSHRVVDVNDLDSDGLVVTAGGAFDRVISVEMLEHVRNHRRLFGRLASMLDGDGSVYLHVFAHREWFWPFEDEGAANWMTRHFFSGGVMPSADLFERVTTEQDLPGADPGLRVAERWWFSGEHYARTLDAWLALIDTKRAGVNEVLAPVYGDDLDRWVQRWRMFMMACSELFGYDGGRQWGVSHQRLEPPRKG